MDIDLRRDGVVLGLLALTIVLLTAGLTGADRVFGYALVAFVGVLLGFGFVNREDPVTWIPPIVAVAVLLVAFTGMFAYESTEVRGPGDTVLGFQPGTAFLVYVLWVPAFFTFGAGLAIVFNRLGALQRPTSPRRGSQRP